MRLRPIVGQPGNSSIINRVKLRQTTVQLGKRAGFDNVGHHLGLTIGEQINVCKSSSLSTGPAAPLTGAKMVQDTTVVMGGCGRVSLLCENIVRFSQDFYEMILVRKVSSCEIGEKCASHHSQIITQLFTGWSAPISTQPAASSDEQCWTTHLWTEQVRPH